MGTICLFGTYLVYSCKKCTYIILRYFNCKNAFIFVQASKVSTFSYSGDPLGVVSSGISKLYSTLTSLALMHSHSHSSFPTHSPLAYPRRWQSYLQIESTAQRPYCFAETYSSEQSQSVKSSLQTPEPLPIL